MSTKDVEITRDMLWLYLSYDEATGRLTWKKRVPGCDLFKRNTPSQIKGWNTKHAGKMADTSICGAGYRRVKLANKDYSAHRLIWMMEMGEWPENIDHINGEKTDNRISNLRNVSLAENSQNRPAQKNNTSGVTGVKWNKHHGRWAASIQINRERVDLGFFTEFGLAVKARKDAEHKYGFHENHGRLRARQPEGNTAGDDGEGV